MRGELELFPPSENRLRLHGTIHVTGLQKVPAALVTALDCRSRFRTQAIPDPTLLHLLKEIPGIARCRGLCARYPWAICIKGYSHDVHQRLYQVSELSSHHEACSHRSSAIDASRNRNV